MAVPAVFLFLVSLAFFPSRPPTPPSTSSAEERSVLTLSWSEGVSTTCMIWLFQLSFSSLSLLPSSLLVLPHRLVPAQRRKGQYWPCHEVKGSVLPVWCGGDSCLSLPCLSFLLPFSSSHPTQHQLSRGKVSINLVMKWRGQPSVVPVCDGSVSDPPSTSSVEERSVVTLSWCHLIFLKWQCQHSLS